MNQILTQALSWGILIGVSTGLFFVSAFVSRLLWEALKFGWTIGYLF